MKIFSVVGARPQFIKAAVFRSACFEHGIEEFLFHSGQHYDSSMSAVFFDQLGVKSPDFVHTLVGRSHGAMTGELLSIIESKLIEQKPDIVNVYGDTNTTLAAALAASKLHIPVSHVEAGLRSYNRSMPEEVNRVLTDHVSDFLFCPTHAAVNNLQSESIYSGVHHVGDIMFDCVQKFKDKFIAPSSVLSRIGQRELAVLTIHRAESLSKRSVLKELIDYARSFSGQYDIFFPIHPNTKKHLELYDLDLGDIVELPPLSYVHLQGLLSVSSLVLTDSGGLQKEAYFHRVPCITLRSETEWIETIDSGWNKLWGAGNWQFPRTDIQEYGDAMTSEHILNILS